MNVPKLRIRCNRVAKSAIHFGQGG